MLHAGAIFSEAGKLTINGNATFVDNTADADGGEKSYTSSWVRYSV